MIMKKIFILLFVTVLVLSGAGYVIWLLLLNMPLSPPSEEVWRYEQSKGIDAEQDSPITNTSSASSTYETKK